MHRTASIVTVAIVTCVVRPAGAAPTEGATPVETAAAAPAFGDPGGAVFEVDFASASRSQDVPTGSSRRALSTGVGAGTVLGGDWTVGAHVSFTYSHQTYQGGTASARDIAAEAVAGRLLPVSSLVSFWLRLGVGYARTNVESSNPTIVLFEPLVPHSFVADADALLLLHPGAHFFVALGPSLRARLGSSSQETALGGRFSFGWCI